MVMSFKWEIQDFPESFAALTDGSIGPLTSRIYKEHGLTWRAILTKDLDVFLQLVSTSFPATVEIR